MKTKLKSSLTNNNNLYNNLTKNEINYSHSFLNKRVSFDNTNRLINLKYTSITIKII